MEMVVAVAVVGVVLVVAVLVPGAVIDAWVDYLTRRGKP